MGRVTEAQRELLSRANRNIDMRAKPFAAALQPWLARFALFELRFALRNPHAYASGAFVSKREDDLASMSIELQRLVLQFGLRQAADSANDAAGAPIIPGSLFTDALDNRPVSLRWFAELQRAVLQRVDQIVTDTRVQARDVVQRILRDAATEWPQPSVGEIARRIRSDFMDADEEERAAAFSPERAAVIARTELTQAENTGIVAGYQASGVTEIEWLAYRDGKSGKRRHDEMSGVRIRLGEKFVLPSGAHLRYPGDPDGPITETINCRCTTAPVVI